MNAAPRTTGSPSRNPEDLALPRAMRWLRERWSTQQASRPLPAPRKPRRQKLPSIRRNPVTGWWTARLAAGSGVQVDEFLRHRLTRYLSVLPVSPQRLPVSIAIDEAGAVVATPREPVAGASRPAWLERYLRREGPAALQIDLQLAQAEVARLSAARDEQQARVNAAAREAEGAAAQPEVFEADGGAETLGRPAVPLPWAAMIQAFGVALLLAEAWQLAIPVLEASGIRTSELARELQRNTAGVVLGFVFALGAAVSLFYFADVAVRRMLDLHASLGDGARRGWGAAVSLACLTFAAAVAWSIAGLRPGAQRVDVEYARFALFLLALALPLTTSCLLRAGRRLQVHRDEALRRAVEWDQAHYRVLSGWSRSAAALASAQRELARLESARVEAIRRLRNLRQMAALAEQYASEAAAEEELELEQLCHAVTTALELDRYVFLRVAGPERTPAARQQPVVGARRDETSLGLAS